MSEQLYEVTVTQKNGASVVVKVSDPVTILADHQSLVESARANWPGAPVLETVITIKAVA